MLTDVEILELQRDETYKGVFNVKLKHVFNDILKCPTDDFKPELSWVTKVISMFIKERIIRSEFSSSTQLFLENILNRELNCPRKPQTIKNICEYRNDFLWMRYDEEIVKALCNKSISLLNNAEYRDLIKRKSTIKEDKNERIRTIITEIAILLKKTLFSMRHHGIFDSWIELSKEEFYEIHGEDMEEKFMKRLQQGNLGGLYLNIKNNGNNEN